MNSGLYLITNTANGKIYIGQASNFRTRWNQHKSSLNLNKHTNQHLQRAWSVYGESSFTFTPIIYCNDKNLMNEYEKDLIFLTNSIDDQVGYNIHSGGKSYAMSEETKRKISKANKGKQWTESQRDKLTGHHLSDETKGKISKVHKGKVVSEETRLKQSIALTGHIVLEETREKISKIKTGHSVTQETRDKISEGHKDKPKLKMRKPWTEARRLAYEKSKTKDHKNKGVPWSAKRREAFEKSRGK